ncbi:hypothetical protein [Actinorugispora endophytica]|uniref:Uncharacterized protein n=1 Tax=Actinorugispora endophytica TaxID=1605990 RepID=A0A4R6UXW0_9ACTN|nr:hypothetical protein [Actinorugispora endophytica]TDQ52271.1 hypothetical protein EV190_107103 [Actinorugispora endophytica]
MRYLPVTKDGVVVGYLWASTEEEAAGLLKASTVRTHTEGMRVFVFWAERLDSALADGLTALQALKRWGGAPEDPIGGAIPPDAREEIAPNLDEMKRISWK